MCFTEMHHLQCVAVSAFDGFAQFHTWYFIIYVPYSSVVTGGVIKLTLQLGSCLRFFTILGEKVAL